MAKDMEVSVQLQEMVSNQYRLNQVFIGKTVASHAEEKLLFDFGGWAAVAAEGGLVDYRSAVLDEAVELHRSDEFWKFWKNPPVPDLLNMKMEYVDMLHFLMSEDMSHRYGEVVLETRSKFTFESLEEGIVARTVSEMLEGLSEAKEDASSKTPRQLLARSHLFSVLSLLLLPGENGFVDWSSFWKLGEAIDFPFEQVTGVYRAKSVLNEFRIANGDREKVYKRKWILSDSPGVVEAQEDNFHLLNWYLDEVKEGRDPSREEINSWLESSYKSIVN